MAMYLLTLAKANRKGVIEHTRIQLGCDMNLKMLVLYALRTGQFFALTRTEKLIDRDYDEQGRAMKFITDAFENQDDMEHEADMLIKTANMYDA